MRQTSVKLRPAVGGCCVLQQVRVSPTLGTQHLNLREWFSAGALCKPGRYHRTSHYYFPPKRPQTDFFVASDSWAWRDMVYVQAMSCLTSATQAHGGTVILQEGIFQPGVVLSQHVHVQGTCPARHCTELTCV